MTTPQTCDIDTAVRLAEIGQPWAVEVVNVEPDQTRGPAWGLRASSHPTQPGVAVLRFGVLVNVWLCNMTDPAVWNGSAPIVSGKRAKESKDLSPTRALESVRRKLDRGWKYLSDVTPPHDIRDRVRRVAEWLPGSQMMDLAAEHGWTLIAKEQGWRVYRAQDWSWWVARTTGDGLRVGSLP